MTGLHISSLLLLSLVTSYVLASSYPSWLVMVTIKCKKQTDRCLGAAVANNQVVTAARCFNKCSVDSAKITVYTGLSKSPRGTLALGEKMRRTEVTVHPEYDSSTRLHDIALIKTNCLPTNTAKLYPVDDCSSFTDATEYNFCDLSNQKTLVEYNVTRSRTRACTKEHKGTFLKSHMLCFRKSQCSDNTVGLAVRNNKLFALSTFGLDCETTETKAYKTFGSLDLCKYSSWIKKQISKGGKN